MNQHKRIVIFLQVLFGFSASAFLAMMPFILPNFQASSNVISLSGNDHDRANSVAYSPDGKVIAVGAASGIYYFDADSNQKLRFVPTETWVRSIAFSPNGSLLATGSYDPVARLWDPRTGELIAELSGHTAWIRSIAFSPDGNLLATASDDDTVRLWDPTTMESILILEENVTGVRSVAFSPNGGLLATGGSDNIVRLWDSTDGTLERELVGHEGWVRSLAFSPDGQFLASGGFDADILLWKLDDGTLLRKLDSHSSSVLSLAFSPDGKLLSSGSVDTTVRLWAMPSGEPYDLLTGHSDFVFSVAFSPDGKQIVSGAVDHTIRIWSVPDQTNPTALEIVSAPTNCISCHHSPGPNIPARVIEPGCATCHSEGALVRNWCPWFPRSEGLTTVNVSSEYLLEDPGFPQFANNLGIEISSPGNGEHIYGSKGIITLIPIQGVVFSPTVPLSEIEVQLEIWSISGDIEILYTNPAEDGSFSFYANIRPDGNQITVGSFNAARDCGTCHTQAASVLPTGNVHLVVRATAPDGSQASDERLITNDNSSITIIPVRIVLENGDAAANIPVHATTRLYEWRGRAYTQASNASGQADLEVETLSTVPTIYQVSVPPVVIDGIWYESMGTASVILMPGEAQTPVTTIEVREITGRITGTIADAQIPVQVVAIHLPDGETLSTQSSGDGEFLFANLPIGQYEIAAIEDGNMQHLLVDLTQSPTTSIELPSLSTGGVAISGQVTDANDNWLPFAWVGATSAESGVNPATGVYNLAELPNGVQSITVSAPGFYSQSQSIDTANDTSTDFNLVQRPETEAIAWGEGEIIIPAETIASEENGSISFEQGWIWGQGQSETPVTIQFADAIINLRRGKFALEKQVGQTGWLYLFEGEATVNWATSEPITVVADEMVSLSENSPVRTVKYNPLVVQVLHAGSGKPISNVWQPGMEALINTWTTGVVIFIAQAITLVTYLAALLSLFAFPVAVANQVLRRRQGKRKK